jgi:hypothetical protein
MDMNTGGQQYGNAGVDYYAKVVMRKISNFFLSYPEFVFLGRILIGILILVIVFILFKNFLAPKEPVSNLFVPSS